MGAYFKGWRRKIGCVTLVMACGFMAVWVRSQTICDLYDPGSGHGSAADHFRTFPVGVLCIRTTTHPSGPGNIGQIRWNPGWRRTTVGPSDTDDPTRFINMARGIKWSWRGSGFDLGQLNDSEPPASTRLDWWLIPHWFMTLPRTLLSAYLLLAKPCIGKSCQTTQRKNTQPVPTDAATS